RSIHSSCAHQALPSFPTRRSSDLILKEGTGEKVDKNATLKVNYVGVNGRTGKEFDSSYKRGTTADFPLAQVVPGFAKGLVGKHRSEEHTSELQSLTNLVCRLLLEK